MLSEDLSKVLDSAPWTVRRLFGKQFCSYLETRNVRTKNGPVEALENLDYSGKRDTSQSM